MEIVPGVQAVDLGMVNAYLYRERDRLTLIDAGLFTHAERIIDEIAALDVPRASLRQIVITHAHADHRGSTEELARRTGAQVLAHALEAPVVRGEAEEAAPVFESDTERELYERIVADVPPVAPCAVDRELRDGEEIDLGGGARVVHVPGHTVGSIAVYVPARKLLFSGDAAARAPDGQVIVGVFNADPARARASFAKLAALDFEVACFGHGAPLDKEASFAFRRRVEALAR